MSTTTPPGTGTRSAGPTATPPTGAGTGTGTAAAGTTYADKMEFVMQEILSLPDDSPLQRGLAEYGLTSGNRLVGV